MVGDCAAVSVSCGGSPSGTGASGSLDCVSASVSGCFTVSMRILAHLNVCRGQHKMSATNNRGGGRHTKLFDVKTTHRYATGGVTMDNISVYTHSGEPYLVMTTDSQPVENVKVNATVYTSNRSSCIPVLVSPNHSSNIQVCTDCEPYRSSETGRTKGAGRRSESEFLLGS